MVSEVILCNLEKEYQLVVDIILQNADGNGICKISQYEIADILSLHQGRVAKIFKTLYNDNCIKKIGNSEYKIIRKDFKNLGPLTKLIKLQSALKENPDIINFPRKEQAELLGLTLESLKSTYGLLYGTYGSIKSND